MDNINLKATVNRTLELLAENGMSPKKLREYKGSGFAVILNYYESRNLSSVASEMLNSFILEQRKALDNNEISQWKWRLLRRCCELLKICSEKDTINLPRLTHWDMNTNCPKGSLWACSKNVDQISESDDVYLHLWKISKALENSGLAKATIHSYQVDGLEVILKTHCDAGKTQYSPALVENEVAIKREQYEKGQIKRSKYQNFRKAAYWLREMHDTGKITFERIPVWNLREPSESFKRLLDEYAEYAEKTGNLSERSICIICQVIRRFMFELEDHGYNSLTCFSRSVVNKCLNDFMKHYSGNLHNVIYPLKNFFFFLFKRQITDNDLSRSFPEFSAKKKTFHLGFTKDELLCILEQPDQNTDLGKRDYAIMILAVQTGLRGCDIVDLKFGDIDWRKREIRIIQRKTGKPVTLPLEPESGNAIAEYILHGRPQTDLPYLFLCHTGICRPIKSRSVGTIVSRYMKKCGIDSNYRAIHAMRRTFGTAFLQNDISLEMIQQLLGHSNINSTKPYLSIDEQGLKKCALPLLRKKDGGAK